MITPHEAVSKAKAYLFEIARDEQIEDVRVEEVELETQKNSWLITLGYIRPRPIQDKLRAAQDKSAFSALFRDEDQEEQGVEDRVYKRFRINAETGSVESMTIRVVC